MTEENSLIVKGDMGTAYGHSKADGEREVLKAIEKGLDVVLLRDKDVSWVGCESVVNEKVRRVLLPV